MRDRACPPSLLQVREHAPHAPAAKFILRAAEPWSIRTHDLWGAKQRARAVALALGTIVFYGLVQAPERPPLDELRLADPSGLGLMFGVSLLMFSCHLEAVTIEQDMARHNLMVRPDPRIMAKDWSLLKMLVPGRVVMVSFPAE